MSLKEPILDEVIFEKVKSGNGSIDDILSLKKEYNISILEIIGALQRLENSKIITWLENKFITNNEE